jgi:transcription antitermination protein NusB
MASDLTAAGKRDRAGARRRAREYCLALLYAADSGGGRFEASLEEADALLTSLFEVWELPLAETAKLRPTVDAFGRRLYEQFLAHREEIDARIEGLSQGWTLDRMPVVDRNLLRMALAELLFLPDIPVGATIDEAVDLAKEYGTAESGKFINGILGAVARELQAAPSPLSAEAE